MLATWMAMPTEYWKLLAEQTWTKTMVGLAAI
jgi:hypothetical protein